ncbi:histidine phosphatase superfamily [Lipomyces chichibuensis]|uniref:histidine phosphatase superfamily n=1 Tax=Lipomyces chichibuensis TaxID=1546026 RepID=UPI00334387D0
MGRPRLIILLRHGESESNCTFTPRHLRLSLITKVLISEIGDKSINRYVPNHKVPLTSRGHEQALAAGKRLREILLPGENVLIYTSPYRRTRETTEEIVSQLDGVEYRVYEEPRLREQDFGNFQFDEVEMSRIWKDRARYGHFFYRIPNGESAADVYDRCAGFNETLFRQFSSDKFAKVLVLVTHGLMSRVFLMKWYRWTVERFESLKNVNYCEFVVMERQDNGKYLLKNKMRTWNDPQPDPIITTTTTSPDSDGNSIAEKQNQIRILYEQVQKEEELRETIAQSSRSVQEIKESVTKEYEVLSGGVDVDAGRAFGSDLEEVLDDAGEAAENGICLLNTGRKYMTATKTETLEPTPI